MNRLFILAFVILIGIIISDLVLRDKHSGNSIYPAEKPAITWGKILNPTGEIPDTGFKAIYCDQLKPNKIIFQENVDSIAIKYNRHEFHNIDSENFAAYWVGKLKFSADTRKEISINQSWASSHIFIDGKLEYDGSNNNGVFIYEFTAGEHVIEVQYMNNYHTVKYKVTIQDVISQNYTEEEISSIFNKNKLQSPELYYVGVYESSAKDASIKVNLPETEHPVVLWLNSYEAIDWNINSPDKLATVIINSYSPGSHIIGKEAEQIFYLKGWWETYAESQKCTCLYGNFHCENKQDLLDTAKRLSNATGLKLTGYAVNNRASTLNILPYNSKIIEKIEAQKSLNSRLELQCKGQVKPDLHTILQKL